MIKSQVHSKFRLFFSSPGESHEAAMASLGSRVAAFTADGKVAPKSVGVEYLEASKTLVMSLGYRDDEAGYPVHLHSSKLEGVNLSGSAPSSADAIESAMSGFAAKVENAICHEFYVTESGEFVMVLMTHG